MTLDIPYHLAGANDSTCSHDSPCDTTGDQPKNWRATTQEPSRPVPFPIVQHKFADNNDACRYDTDGTEVDYNVGTSMDETVSGSLPLTTADSGLETAARADCY